MHFALDYWTAFCFNTFHPLPSKSSVAFLPLLQFPTEKQSASGTPNNSCNKLVEMDVDQAQARRRAELQRLKNKMVSNDSGGVLNQARTELRHQPPPGRPQATQNAPAARPASSNNIGTSNSRVPMRGPGGIAVAMHQSDIFPSVVNKSPPVNIPIKELPTDQAPTPPLVAAPPQPVARRLDASFAHDQASRSTSAPPRRPPPPPPPPRSKSTEDVMSTDTPVSPPATTATPTPIKPKQVTMSKEATAEADAKVPKNSQMRGTPHPKKFQEEILLQSPESGAERRNILRNLRDGANTPPISNKKQDKDQGQNGQQNETSEDTHQTEIDKENALERVAQLEAEIKKIRGQTVASSSSSGLETIVQLADTEGEKSAVKWAREQVVVGGNSKQVGFLSPMMAASPGQDLAPTAVAFSPSVLSPPTSHRRRRMPTPHPKQLNGTPHDKEDERRFQCEAAECIAWEFMTSPSDPEDDDDEMMPATFIVRRPFGLASERDMWFSVGQLNTKLYEKTANVENPSSLEVAVVIEADDSVLAVHGKGTVRRLQNSDGEWKNYGDIEERGQPLGSVTYVDSGANDKTYSLDDIVEAALAAREHYCSAILSTAAYIKDRPAVPQSEPSVQQPIFRSPAADSVPPLVSTGSSDACVGTEDLPFPAEPRAELKSVGSQADAPEPEHAARPPPPEEDDSPDVLATFAGIFFSTMAWVTWTIFVRTPLRIINTTFVLAVSAVLLSFVWLFIADDHGGSEMGASMGASYNPPGIL